MTNLTRLSKFLAVVLRHDATKFGVELDAEGFTDVDVVWKIVQNRYPGQFDYCDLLQVVEGDQHGKKRYEIRDGRAKSRIHPRSRRRVCIMARRPRRSHSSASRD